VKCYFEGQRVDTLTQRGERSADGIVRHGFSGGPGPGIKNL
jgi:hypothetical protein